tara:strand:- start:198 stop:1016 length:819 start_codon:yes stop_codon:yes gene_type:complete
MRKFLNKIIGKILFKIIPNNKSVYNFCKLLINRYNNNKNFYPSKNGEFNLISSFVKSEINQKIIFDVGCNVGEFTYFLKKKNYDGKIYLFDALKSIDSKILENKNVYFFQKLLWNKEEKISFFIDKKIQNAGTNSSFDMKQIGYETNSEKREMNTTTLDNFIEENNIDKIDYLKIDVEGAEYRVLEGLIKNLELNKVKYIHFEYGHAAMADRKYIKDYLSLLKKYNFEMYVIIPQGLRKIEYTPYMENYFDYINLFFTSSENLKLLDIKILD